MPSNFHENLSRTSVEIGSNRAFGVVVGVACLVVSGLGFWLGSAYWPVWAGAAAVFAGLALLWPRLLSPLNRVWFWFGLALHKVVNPIVMGVLFCRDHARRRAHAAYEQAHDRVRIRVR